MIPPATVAELNAHLDELLREQGRRPEAVRRTLMARVVIGRDASEVQAKLGDQSVDELRGRGAIVGTPAEIVDQLREVEATGIHTIMLQWLDGLDDLDGVELLARTVLPAN
jgi:alkanesulfonate monooxygenase SsuD/methylene tetrahydromethanopterin reductase-like flavin-dependent oxidoreductase (luciferase family)